MCLLNSMRVCLDLKLFRRMTCTKLNWRDILTPSNKWNPEVRNQEYDKNVCINFLIEFLRFSKNANAFSAHIKYNDCHCNVEEDGINCGQWFPFEWHSSCKRQRESKIQKKWKCRLPGSHEYCNENGLTGRWSGNRHYGKYTKQHQQQLMIAIELIYVWKYIEYFEFIYKYYCTQLF